MVAKIDRDFVAADLAAVESLVKIAEGDPLASMGLASRRDELRKELAQLQSRNETHASAAIFFSGRPVIASKGIESDFGTAAINKFQDIVTKVFALNHAGSLGQRGSVAGKDLSKLHITNVVHGSFGFQLEELIEQQAIVTTTLKDAVDETTLLIDRFGEEDEGSFEDAVGALDQRVFATITAFFDLVNTNEAAFRLVSDHFDKSFDRLAVGRAVERGRITKINETEQDFRGQLVGALPYAGQFEYDTSSDRGIISGKINPQAIGEQERSNLNKNWLHKDSRVKVQIKQVLKDDAPVRENFTLLSIQSRES